jgi:APA family basic amino acid/polyamine antiporter
LVSLVLTGVVPYKQLGVPDPVAVGIDTIVKLRQWSPTAANSLTFLVKVGAISGLTSVILVMMMGQTRVFYAMAKDGLLPWFDKLHPRYSTPHTATVLTGLFVALCGGLMPISLVGELVSIGTLLAFVLVCTGVFILRIKDPTRERPFRVPVFWLVAPLGALACLWVMSGLPLDTWLRLIVWLVIGFAIYGTYSHKHSKLRGH